MGADKVKPLFKPINVFLILVIAAFTTSLSKEAYAEYYDHLCDNGDAYWVKTPVYHSCKPHKKKYYAPVKKKKVHVKKRYYQAIVVPVYTCARSSCCCYDDCCGNYNPDLTTGDDDPSVYPDLNIDR